VSDNATKHALILAGVGWGSLPLWLVECDLAEGRLVRIAAAEFGQQGETFVRALSGLQDGSLPVLPRERSAKHLADETASRPQRMTKNAQKATRSRGSRSRQS
jgi:DNA-binding transcriptional LysR family regulator